MKRRAFLGLSTALASVALFGGARGMLAASDGEQFSVTHTDAEWRTLLSDDEFAVLREDSTEPKFSSPLLEEKRAGNFHCKGCDLPVYPSDTKYDSKTGWPSFWNSIPDAVRTKSDNTLFTTRTEVHCRRCGSHFGHIFNDGPQPTGKRHCLNGIALTFTAAA